MSAPGTFIQLVVKVSSNFDWFSNPWHTEGFNVATWSGNYELRKLQVSWSRTPTVGVVQDADICTFHFLNLTNGNPDASWITSDYTAVESAFDTFWNNLKINWMPEMKLAEYLWRADGPAFRPHGASLSPTLRITARNVAGGASGGVALPPQCAMSVTEVTEATFIASGVGVPGSAPGTGRSQRRNRWGRFYLPPPFSIALNDGRWDSGVCGLVSGHVKTFYNACVTAGLIPVMYSPTTGNSWSITEVHVDDIVDVIRSRRYITPLTRAVNAINAP